MSEQHSTDFARQLELAWAAGFFDGEGCTSLDVQRNGFSYVRVSINQVVAANLHRFRAAVDGIGSITGPKQRPAGQPICKYRVAGTGARQLLALLWPYLGAAKRKQAGRVMAAEKNKGGVAPALRTHCPQGHPYGEQVAGKRRCKVCDAALHRAKRKTDRPHPKYRTHCPQGHAYATEGRVNGEGKRVCRVCSRAAQRRWAAKQKRSATENPDGGNLRTQSR